jgi:transcriptional regulator with XRE-family HTH domain
LFQNLGNTLALVRNLRRKTQTEVAQEAKIGKVQLSKYENGRELPRLDVLGRLLTALKISIHEFLYTLALVDERMALLSSSETPVERSLLVVPRKDDSLLLPQTEEAFERLQSFVLDLHRHMYRELVFRQIPEVEGGGVRAAEGTERHPRGRKAPRRQAASKPSGERSPSPLVERDRK